MPVDPSGIRATWGGPCQRIPAVPATLELCGSRDGVVKRLVRDHLSSFLAEADELRNGILAFVRPEFERFLACAPPPAPW